MLETRKSASPLGTRDLAAGTGSRHVTDLLLGSIEPYEACILEAERDGDLEVAALLRELRRQDLAREATRLLRRSLEAAHLGVGEERVVC